MNERDKRNCSLNAVGETLFGLKSNMIASATVLTVLLREYGAGPAMLGAVWGVETSFALLPQLFGTYVFASHRRRKRQLLLWHVGVMLPFPLLMGGLTLHAEAIAPAAFRIAMFACHSAYWLSIGIVAAAWTDFIARLFPSAVRGTVVGLSLFGAHFAGTGGALLAGAVITRFPAPQSFGWVYITAWAIGTAAMAMWLPVDDSPVRTAPEPPRVSPRSLVARFRASLADRNYCAYLVGRLLATLGFCIVPFIAVHFRSEAGGALGNGTVVACGAAMTLGLATGSLVLGRLGDLLGHRVGMLAGICAQVAALAVLLTLTGLPGCVLAFALAGLCLGCAAISSYNLTLETCPHEHLMLHISVSNLLLGVPMGLAPVAAGFAAAQLGLRWVFGLCLIVSLCALMWLLVAVKEPRRLALRSGS